jgi:aspartyl-tRNA(Asn)/glutamyl-tRNA(Gln) amidotransferase subunit B
VIIGLEIHAQLATRTKMFCACAVDFSAPPNQTVCPVCLGHPGVLPRVNRRAVELAVRAGVALGAHLAPVSHWARKNYFYPDLPKGYQITQYAEPLATGGSLAFDLDAESHQVQIARLHLEEDAGRLRHPSQGPGRSRIDLNRCGIPLLEIVTEPELRTAREAVECVESLRQILQYCGVCEGDMEKGSLRCDANISLRSPGRSGFGTKTEIKNLNSFRSLERALLAERRRQSQLLTEGRAVQSWTMLWDEAAGQTRPMRSKEVEPDYRYFAEPDLPPLVLEGPWIRRLAQDLPELPRQRRQRFISRWGLRAHEARLLTRRRELADYFEDVARRVPDPVASAKFIGTHLLGMLHEQHCEIQDCPVSPEVLADLLKRRSRGKLSSGLLRQLLAELWSGDRPAAEILRDQRWAQIEDEAELEAWAREVVEAFPEQVTAYRAGRSSLLRFFLGEIMRRSQGRAHPAKARQQLIRHLDASG